MGFAVAVLTALSCAFYLYVLVQFRREQNVLEAKTRFTHVRRIWRGADSSVSGETRRATPC
jgi:hypothetical protein